MGASALSLYSGGSIQAFWTVQRTLSLGDSHFQQRLCCTDLSGSLPKRRADIRDLRGPRNRLDLGGFSLRHLLAGARGLGDQSHRISAEPRAAAYFANG